MRALIVILSLSLLLSSRVRLTFPTRTPFLCLLVLLLPSSRPVLPLQAVQDQAATIMHAQMSCVAHGLMDSYTERISEVCGLKNTHRYADTHTPF